MIDYISAIRIGIGEAFILFALGYLVRYADEVNRRGKRC